MMYLKNIIREGDFEQLPGAANTPELQDLLYMMTTWKEDTKEVKPNTPVTDRRKEQTHRRARDEEESETLSECNVVC